MIWGNTELLAQKHRLLGDAVKETKEKLETLKTVGDNVTNVGKKFMPVTLGVVGLGTAAVKTAADFDSAMSKVAAVSGATGSDLEALRDKAREMGEKTKFSASEAAEAMNYMAMAGWKTEDMLSGIEGVMNLAAASGEDLATTSDIVTDALTAFGLTAKDSGHFADILAAASSNANTNVSMMGETFKYCAPIAGALGFSAEDTAEAIGPMANAGIKSMIGKVGEAVSSVADKIRSFLHFSVPDEGPLTDYESWMPDFIGGLAKGIEKSRGMIENAMNGVTSDLTITPKVMVAQGGYSGSTASSGDLISGINTALNTALAGGGAAGDIVIPVYIGGDMIDEIVVTAQQRMNLRSGGR